MTPNKIDKALDSTIDALYSRASSVIERARDFAYRQVNEALVKRNWELGKLIAEEELNGQDRAIYGASIIKGLSKRLTATYGKGFTKSYLYSFLTFYKNNEGEIFQTVFGKSRPLMSWSHYFVLTQEFNADARAWYEQEAMRQNWSVRTLQRNVGSQYYYRILASQRKDLVEKEMLELTVPLNNRESELEQAIIDNLEKFLLEMGKGFAFVARQQHIHTEKKDYFIDLVFYNYILKCFVLIDLKTTTIEHQDVGQMDMYVRMYDERQRGEGDNPTIGILLCDDTDEDIARYSVLHDNDHLFMSKYMLYLPSPEQLRAEIERQKAIFFLKEKSYNEDDE